VGRRRAVLRPEHASAPCHEACTAREAHCILQLSVDAVAVAARALLRTPAARAPWLAPAP
jgi:hypothetical protein